MKHKWDNYKWVVVDNNYGIAYLFDTRKEVDEYVDSLEGECTVIPPSSETDKTDDNGEVSE